jgi:Rod binding domain-containing protein
MDLSAALAPVTAPPAPSAAAPDAGAAHKAAQNFESYFLQQSFESMFQGIGSDTLFGGGEGETIYRSLLLQEYSKVAAKSGGIGIADAVQREIVQTQGMK